MEGIPLEFSLYSSYLVAAEDIKKYNPIAAQVLTQVFVDICQDIASTQISKTAQDFLTNLSNNLPEFPRDGPDETKLLADDLYESLCSSLRLGKINSHIVQQFWLCGILYSVLAGEEPEKRERICKITAARLNRALKKAEIKKNSSEEKHKNQNKTQKGQTSTSQNLQPQSNKHQNEKPKNDNAQKPNQKSTQPANPQNPAHHHHSNSPPSYESVISHYNEKNAIEYLNSIGVKVPSSTPPLNEKCRSLISQNFDLSLSCLTQSDTEQAKIFLQKAQKAWKTGKP